MIVLSWIGNVVAIWSNNCGLATCESANLKKWPLPVDLQWRIIATRAPVRATIKAAVEANKNIPEKPVEQGEGSKAKFVHC